MQEVALAPNSKLAYIDADTLIYRAAMQAQTNHYRMASDHSKHWKGKREAYAWAEKNGVDKDDLDLELYVHEVLDIEQAEIPLWISIREILDQPWVRDYRLVFGMGGNFRSDLELNLAKYKGHREDKPVHLNDLKKAMFSKYGNRCIGARDEEADDVLGIMGWKWYEYAKSQKDINASDVVLCYIDKDLDMIPGFRWNYFKQGAVYWQDNVNAYKCLCKQLLMGDKTDNIAGMPRYSPHTAEKFGTRKGKSVGEKTALALLEGCDTPKKLAQRVVDVYKTEFGDKPFEYKTWDDRLVTLTWRDIVDENAILLWMRSEEGQMFSFTLDAIKLGCEL